MQHDRGLVPSVFRPMRWAVMLLVLALLGAFAAPLSAVTAQTPVASEASGILEVAPDTTLFFAQANLDPASDQMVLATELTERAGLGNPVEDGAAEAGIPADIRFGIVVTSIPETENLDVSAVSVDPMAATDSLQTGGYAIVLSSSNPQELYASQLEDIQGDADLGGGELVESEYGGVTITSYTPAPDEEYANPGALTMVGDYVVTGVRAEDLQPVIDTFNGDMPSLATNENYQQVNALLPAESIANGFVNGPATLDAVEATSPEALEMAGSDSTDLLNSWSGFSLSAEEQGFRIETRSIPAGEAFDELTPIDGSFFDTVPSEALFATSGTNINANGQITLLAFIFASEFVGEDVFATPAADMDLAAAQDQVFAQAEQMLGFNAKTDFVDLLTGQFGITLTLGDITAETPTVDALIVSEVTDPATMQDTMVKIAMIAGAALGDQTAVEERDVNGSTVNVLDISSSGIADKAEFGVVGDELVISVGGGLDTYVDGPASPMSGDSNFNAVMEHMPGEYGSLTYINMPVVMEVFMGFSESMSASMDIEDADPSCGEYATQDDAQAAYDADQFENFELDQDFDGEACEDYFGGTPVATPTETANPFENVLGLATVTTQEDGVNGTTTFLLIGGQ